MVKPSTPGKKLADLLVSRQGGGKTRRLRRKVTTAEVAEAVALLQTYCPNANLLDPEQCHALCVKVLGAALAPNRIPDPKENWDLVAVFAGLRGIKRAEACVELGLAIQVKSESTSTVQKIALVRDIIRMARKRGDRRMVKDAEEWLALFELGTLMSEEASPPSQSPSIPTEVVQPVGRHDVFPNLTMPNRPRLRAESHAETDLP